MTDGEMDVKLDLVRMNLDMLREKRMETGVIPQSYVVTCLENLHAVVSELVRRGWEREDVDG